MPLDLLPVTAQLKHQKLFQPESFSLDHLGSLYGTSAAIPASDNHTGRSAQEVLSVSASICGRTEVFGKQGYGAPSVQFLMRKGKFASRSNPPQHQSKQMSLLSPAYQEHRDRLEEKM